MSHILEEIFFACQKESYKVNCWLCLSLVKIIPMFILREHKIIRKLQNLSWHEKI